MFKSPADWSRIVKEYTLAHESDLVGIAEIDPNWIYEGYEIREPRVIIIGVEMDYAELAQAPSSFENPSAAVVVAKEYNRAARACRELRNFILSGTGRSNPFSPTTYSTRKVSSHTVPRSKCPARP